MAFSRQAWADYAHWQSTDQTILAKINGLTGECMRHPFSGTGKPEPLKKNFKGCWSRRIDREHRLVYRISGTGDQRQIDILQCRYHYEK